MEKHDLKEIEVKIKVDDFGKIEEELLKLNCKLSDPVTQIDKIYLPNGIKFTEIKTDTNILRIRRQNDKNIFTLKRNSETSLSKIEYETVFENAEQMEKIFDTLNFYQAASVKKTRRKCKYNDMEICLDDVEGLGKYIEIEKMTSDDPQKTQKELLEVLESLDVNTNNRAYYGYDILIYLKDHPEDTNKF